MDVRYINLLGTPIQIEQTKNIIDSYNLKSVVLEESAIRQELVAIEIKVEGNKVEVIKLVEYLQKSN